MEQITVVGIDPGSEVSGLVIVRYGRIVKAANVANDLLFNIMLEECATNLPLLVLIEDVKPYGVRLRQELLDTCKWIGKLVYWLELAGIGHKLISRSTVRTWVYNSFPDIVVPRIEREIICRDHRRKDGEYCKPSAKYVNDRIVEAAMKEKWSVPKPKPGRTNVYGLKTHSWQALALISCFISNNP